MNRKLNRKIDMKDLEELLDYEEDYIGSEVELLLSDGQLLTGIFQGIDEDTILLKAKDGKVTLGWPLYAVVECSIKKNSNIQLSEIILSITESG